MVGFGIRFLPIRADHKRDKYVTMIVKVVNMGEQEELVSLDIIIKGGRLALDPTMVHKKGVKKIGKVQPGEEKEVYVRIYLDTNTQPGMYPIEVRLNRHYNDFDHIIDVRKKVVELRVI
jgi:uncharacterized membrane protein